MFNWYREITSRERKTFWGCFGGWALDALDVQMFSLAIPALIATFGLDKTDAGLISGVTLVSSALGGWIMGAVSDRIGQVRALQLTIAWFSLFTLLSAFAAGFGQLLVLKALQGFGFGGEWAAGAVLMAEVIRPEHRGKAMGTVQSAWAVGWGAAVLLYSAVYLLLPPDLAWPGASCSASASCRRCSSSTCAATSPSRNASRPGPRSRSPAGRDCSPSSGPGCCA